MRTPGRTGKCIGVPGGNLILIMFGGVAKMLIAKRIPAISHERGFSQQKECAKPARH
jgi:hypothetical protein